MNSATENPRKIAWAWYDKSELANFLRHDKWTWTEGLSLICDIDPTQSRLRVEPRGRRLKGYDKSYDPPALTRASLLSDDPIFNFYCHVENTGAGMGVDLDEIRFELGRTYRTDINLDDFEINDIRMKVFLRFRSGQDLMKYWRLFASDPAHLRQESFAPSYFIHWAISKEIAIPWLDWAEHNGYVLDDAKTAQRKPKETQAVSVTKTPSNRAPERDDKKIDEIVELRAAAKVVAIKLRTDGIQLKRITIKRICQDLLTMTFSTGIPFASRWGSFEGMRSHLKNEHNPKKSSEFRAAKADRANFNL